MNAADAWLVALVGATALHAGFQATVTLVVYPALAAVPADAWDAAHDRHSRRIAPLVGIVYAAALVASGGALVTSPGAGTAAAATVTLATVLVTALSAAPTHDRLSSGPTPELLRTLLRADRLRCLFAALALAGALAATLDW